MCIRDSIKNELLSLGNVKSALALNELSIVKIKIAEIITLAGFLFFVWDNIWKTPTLAQVRMMHSEYCFPLHPAIERLFAWCVWKAED